MKKAVIILSVLAIFVSCNQQKTIQTYIVEKQDKPGFMSVDLPMSLIQLNSDKVPLDVKDGYESIKKVNVLGLPYLNNNEAYEIEKKAISLILNNSKIVVLFSLQGKPYFLSVFNHHSSRWAQQSQHKALCMCSAAGRMPAPLDAMSSPSNRGHHHKSRLRNKDA